MNYYSLNNEVYAFDDDQLSFVSKEMIKMTDEEIDRHLNSQNYYTDEEKRAAYLASLPNLSKRQFNLYLYDNQKLDDVNNLLANNPRFKIEFDSTDTIVRTSSTVDAMITLLGWTDEQVDSMWEEALTL